MAGGTKIDDEELTNHMISVHKWGAYPCNYDHCDYIVASTVVSTEDPVGDEIK